MQPRRPQVHARAVSSTTTWPISPAPPRPVHGSPSRISPPPTPVPQKTPSSELYRRPAPSWNSATVATCTSLPSGPPAAAVPAQRRREREGALPAGEVARARDGAVADRARRARRPRRRARQARARRPWRRRAATCTIAAATSSGPPSVGVGRRAEPSTVLSSSTTTAWIFVPPRSIPPYVGIAADHRRRPPGRPRAITARAVRAASGAWGPDRDRGAACVATVGRAAPRSAP